MYRSAHCMRQQRCWAAQAPGATCLAPARWDNTCQLFRKSQRSLGSRSQRRRQLSPRLAVVALCVRCARPKPRSPTRTRALDAQTFEPQLNAGVAAAALLAAVRVFTLFCLCARSEPCLKETRCASRYLQSCFGPAYSSTPGGCSASRLMRRKPRVRRSGCGRYVSWVCILRHCCNMVSQ